MFLYVCVTCSDVHKIFKTTNVYKICIKRLVFTLPTSSSVVSVRHRADLNQKPFQSSSNKIEEIAILSMEIGIGCQAIKAIRWHGVMGNSEHLALMSTLHLMMQYNKTLSIP